MYVNKNNYSIPPKINIKVECHQGWRIPIDTKPWVEFQYIRLFEEFTYALKSLFLSLCCKTQWGNFLCIHKDRRLGSSSNFSHWGWECIKTLCILTFRKPEDTAPSFSAAASSCSTFSRPLWTACISSARVFNCIWWSHNRINKQQA